MKPPTQFSIAKELGISRATVAEILGGKSAHRYNEETRQRVIDFAKAKGYRPNRSARLLTGVQSGVVGIFKSISPFQRNTELVLHAAEAIHRQGYEIMSADWYAKDDEMNRAVNALLDAKVEGVVIAHLHAAFIEKPAILRLAKANIPIVGLGGEPLEGIPFVTPNYFQASELAVEHLAACGYDKLIMLARHDWQAEHLKNFPTTWAAKGFLAAAKKAGYADENVEIIVPRPNTDTRLGMDLGVADAQNLVKELVRRKDKASYGLIFLTDYQAMVTMQLCHQLGLRLPEQIGVIAYDGGYAADFTWPSLTAIKLPTQEVAHLAIDLLFETIRGNKATTEEPITHPCKLIARASTRPVSD